MRIAMPFAAKSVIILNARKIIHERGRAVLSQNNLFLIVACPSRILGGHATILIYPLRNGISFKEREWTCDDSSISFKVRERTCDDRGISSRERERTCDDRGISSRERERTCNDRGISSKVRERTCDD